jgi:hypothetical protein
MIESVLRLSIERRYLVLSFIFVVIGIGVWSYQHLPIDAVPDITNVQVQINTEAPGYSPLEVEQRITFPVETALAGLPNLSYTRSLSRYGLSQVTVVFEEGTDIYFARNLINERLNTVKNLLPGGLDPAMGPIATGLGEIFTYTVEALPGAVKPDGNRTARPTTPWHCVKFRIGLSSPSWPWLPALWKSIPSAAMPSNITSRLIRKSSWLIVWDWRMLRKPCGVIIPIWEPGISSATANNYWCVYLDNSRLCRISSGLW